MLVSLQALLTCFFIRNTGDIYHKSREDKNMLLKILAAVALAAGYALAQEPTEKHTHEPPGFVKNYQAEALGSTPYDTRRGMVQLEFDKRIVAVGQLLDTEHIRLALVGGGAQLGRQTKSLHISIVPMLLYGGNRQERAFAPGFRAEVLHKRFLAEAFVLRFAPHNGEHFWQVEPAELLARFGEHLAVGGVYTSFCRYGEPCGTRLGPGAKLLTKRVDFSLEFLMRTSAEPISEGPLKPHSSKCILHFGVNVHKPRHSTN